MPYIPILSDTDYSQSVVDTFGGYNHNMAIGDGELYDMVNLCSDYYPLIGSRAARGYVRTLTTPKGMLAKSKLAYIDGTSLYYDGVDVTSYLTAADVTIGSDSGPRQMVSMGAYIIIFPDKVYFNTEDFEDCGTLNNTKHFIGTSGNLYFADVIYFALCKKSGEEYGDYTTSDEAPASPTDGTLWMDKSNGEGTLKKYNGTEWVEQSDVAISIQRSGIGKGFAAGDYIDISGFGNAQVTGVAGQPLTEYDYVSMTYNSITGTSESTEGNYAVDHVKGINGKKKILSCGETYIVVEGFVYKTYREQLYDVTLYHSIPDMDYVTEAQNRLWGCKYGIVDGETVNEIYACALGDFKAWSTYEGLSTDSYTASVGTDGPWTGAITFMGYPIFFKENYMHKVFVSSNGAHQITDTACRGVQNGSSRSLVVVNETLFYKSQGDIMAYDGSIPTSVSFALGQEKYKNAVAGSIGDKYYISMQDISDNWHLFVLDTVKSMWHREDDLHALFFARSGEELYTIRDDGHMLAMRGSIGTPETGVEWSATTGLIGCGYVEQKYVSRLNLRMKLPVGSKADMYVQYDSDGLWHFAGHMDGVGTNSFTLPIRPRRCDHFRFKIDGRGEVRIYSMAKNIEKGSDV